MDVVRGILRNLIGNGSSGEWCQVFLSSWDFPEKEGESLENPGMTKRFVKMNRNL